MLDHPSLWSAAFIHLASLAYVIAFLTTNQYSLRLLVVVGTLLELLYFYFIADAPLWDAIVWSIIFLAANLFTLSRLPRDRMGIDLDDDELRLHSALPDIQPGDFRQIAKLSRRCTALRRTDLTREGGPLDGLYFLLDGMVELDKGGSRQRLENRTFIGEIAYLLSRPASATVTVEARARYLAWDADDLRGLAGRRDGVRYSLDQAFSRDLAQKLTRQEPGAAAKPGS